MTGALLVWFPSGGPDRRDLTMGRALRGGPVFDVLHAAREVLPGRHQLVLQSGPDEGGSAESPMPIPGRRDVVFAPLGLLVDAPQFVRRIVGAEAALIVDVHFPLPRPDDILALQDVPDGGQRNEVLDEFARDQWRNPARVRTAYQILRAADCVTFSPAGSVDLAQFPTPPLGGPLPDVKSLQETAVFYRRFALAVWALQSDLTGWRRRAARRWWQLQLLRASADIMARVQIDEGVQG